MLSLSRGFSLQTEIVYYRLYKANSFLMCGNDILINAIRKCKNAINKPD